jgi:hypothetical protein
MNGARMKPRRRAAEVENSASGGAALRLGSGILSAPERPRTAETVPNHAACWLRKGREGETCGSARTMEVEARPAGKAAGAMNVAARTAPETASLACKEEKWEPGTG